MKPIRCTLKMNSPLNGYEYQPIECNSISEALRIAERQGSPYRIYVKGKLVRKGWRP